MKTFMMASIAAALALFLTGGAPVTGHAQPCPCVVICPAGDGTTTPAPLGGTKSPDLNSDGAVGLLDLAILATGWPPNPYMFCIDYNCDGIITLPDLAIFAVHYGHSGPIPGYNAPGIDHYKLYDTLSPPFQGPVFVRDQFGQMDIPELWMSKFATPVSKNNEPMCDPMAHQSWWEFPPQPGPVWLIEAQDQFGTHEWALFGAVYLVLPALKNEGVGQPLPVLNHYLCYEAQGPVLQIPVVLADQFDVVDVVVLQGVYFCNPCEKVAPDGMLYPIVDPWAHMTVYAVQNPIPYAFPVLVQDQFMVEELFLAENHLLAVPALKTEVFPMEQSEWDRIQGLRE